MSLHDRVIRVLWEKGFADEVYYSGSGHGCHLSLLIPCCLRLIRVYAIIVLFVVCLWLTIETAQRLFSLRNWFTSGKTFHLIFAGLHHGSIICLGCVVNRENRFGRGKGKCTEQTNLITFL